MISLSSRRFISSGPKRSESLFIKVITESSALSASVNKYQSVSVNIHYCVIDLSFFNACPLGRFIVLFILCFCLITVLGISLGRDKGLVVSDLFHVFVYLYNIRADKQS